LHSSSGNNGLGHVLADELALLRASCHPPRLSI